MKVLGVFGWRNGSLILSVYLLVFGVFVGRGLKGDATNVSFTDQVRVNQEPVPSEHDLDMERKRQRALKKQEYEESKKLAEELLKSAQDLKDTIEKAGENTFPLKAIRKIDDIELLAKKLKSKLKGN